MPVRGDKSNGEDKREYLFAVLRPEEPRDHPKDLLCLYAIAHENGLHFQTGEPMTKGCVFPVKTLAKIARLIGLDPRTARKRVKSMVASGIIAKTPDGYLVSPEALRARATEGKRTYLKIPLRLLQRDLTPWACILAGRLAAIRGKGNFWKARSRLVADLGIDHRRVWHIEAELKEACVLLKLPGDKLGKRSYRMLVTVTDETEKDIQHTTLKEEKVHLGHQEGHPVRSEKDIQCAAKRTSSAPHPNTTIQQSTQEPKETQEVQEALTPAPDLGGGGGGGSEEGASASASASAGPSAPASASAADIATQARDGLKRHGWEMKRHGDDELEAFRKTCAEDGGDIPSYADVLILTRAAESKTSPAGWLTFVARDGRWISEVESFKTSSRKREDPEADFNGANFRPPQHTAEEAPPEADWKPSKNQGLNGMMAIVRANREAAEKESSGGEASA